MRRLLPVPAARGDACLTSPAEAGADHRHRGVGVPAAAAGLAEHRDGARRRRGDVGRTDRAPVPAGVRPRRRRGHGRRGGHRASAVSGWRSRPTRSWSSRWSSPAASIGDLAVNGTVNDLAMAGARPLVLSTAFILEEGTPLDEIARVAHGRRHGGAGGRRQAGHRRHQGGRLPATATASTSTPPASAWSTNAPTSGRSAPPPGDVVIVSGDIGVHGVAVMSCREGLEFAHHRRQRHRAAARAGRRDARHRRRHARAARPDPRRRRRDPERDRQDRGRRHRARRARRSRSPPRSATPAGCSASTRC